MDPLQRARLPYARHRLKGGRGFNSDECRLLETTISRHDPNSVGRGPEQVENFHHCETLPTQFREQAQP
jgi:hypothetical protein